ncbi:MAG TPA: gliding motility-associated C-terminal domain-containing protein [Chitinophagaceae bacterium]|nr:gliding motility-associated C-terminal domain-containing protein [Chitinophagaceae bacterium]
MRLLILSLVYLFIFQRGMAQSICTGAGQNPETAFPVCGTSTFQQNTVPLCGGRPVAYKGCPGNGLTDINPYWYKFTCFTSGTLGFVITPKDLSDDYDWELYDITGVNPSLVYTNDKLVVSNNWSGESGLTGASNAGSQQFVCGGPGKALFSKMPTLIQGHNYLLLISHFTRTQSGYSLSFGGGTTVITDPNGPRLKNAEASCGGDVIKVGISKKIKCSSIATDGSDFYIKGNNITFSSAVGINCSSSFDSDSIELKLSGFLQPGTYNLRIKKGSDANTLSDYCDVQVPESDEVSFTIQPKSPTPMDSMIPLTCAPKQLKLIFSKPILCSSIAKDGSDFLINGVYPVIISGVTGNCSGNSTKEIFINLSSAMQQGGSFTLNLKKGSDGNTLVNECGEETRSGSSLSFLVKDTVNADFTYRIFYGCEIDTVGYLHDGKNGVTKWQWNLDDGLQSNTQNTVAYYSTFTTKNSTLVVSNGLCSDTAKQTILLNNFLKADFTAYEDNCPLEPIQFTSTAKGKIVKHNWKFGDGEESAIATPTHTYAQPQRETPFIINYAVTDSLGCTSEIQKKVIIYASCFLAVPNAFTPNNDGLNDLFYPANAVKAENLQFTLYNRWGELIYKTNDWKKGWNGTVNGKPQQAGIYIWMLQYTDRDTKKSREQKGTVMLIR